MTATWEPLGAVPPRDLGDARLQLHWAVQLVSALGHSVLEADDDDGHASMIWNVALDAMVGRPLGALSAALRLRDLTLLLVEGDRAVAAHGLQGDSLMGGRSWLEAELSQRGVDTALSLPRHNMPMHGVGSGQPFGVDAAALVELSRWYANAHGVLTALASLCAAPAPVLCWPHHFDIAVVLTLDDDLDRDRSINAGMSPGDEYYDEPYFYVTPWPPPRADMTFPALSVGSWHHLGWCGAVATGSEILGKGGDQDAVAQRFLRGSVAASLTLIGAPRDSLA